MSTATTRARRETVDSFIKNYDIPEKVSDAERAADFLHALSRRFPGDFINKRNLVRIACNLKMTPSEGSDKLKKLAYIVGRADKILQRKYNSRVVSDRVEGYRATHDDTDLETTRYRRDLARVNSAQRAAINTAQMIDPKNLKGSVRDEFLKSKDSILRIGKNLADFPLLPPRTPKQQED